MKHDPVTAPGHYTVYPVQPIEITKHMGFCLGNAVKYVLRAPYKGEEEDCRKALQYLIWEEETPHCTILIGKYREIADPLDFLAQHLRATENHNPHLDDITDIQADFLVAVDAYLVSGEVEYLHTMRDLIAELSGAMISTTRETATRPAEGE